MTDTTNASTGGPGADSMGAPSPAVPPRRYRPRGQAVRDHRVTPSFTGEELSQIRAAADAAGMTLTGFCALAALAVARRRPGEEGRASETQVEVEELAELQVELFATRTAVNRTGINLNQAVAALNSTGAPPAWLQRAVDRVTHAVAEVDAVASEIHRRLA